MTDFASLAAGGTMVGVMIGIVPQPGQTVQLSGDASPQFREQPLRLLITEPPLPSTVDAAQGKPAERASWLLLTGWELGPRGQRVVKRTVSVRTAGVALDQTAPLSRR
ncbi:hypothetical protein Asera_03470 [Actinocatenispora sera]|uniref:Uncharacterized protein n=2 Tax=Actinocatenispora sera TaxID=390989 RepID=A0A810KV57_9ACTN|nr:hypothetical protein Asera_03470 [Actinocatenispora sera]